MFISTIEMTEKCIQTVAWDTHLQGLLQFHFHIDSKSNSHYVHKAKANVQDV